jgi:hypothetical protein
MNTTGLCLLLACTAAFGAAPLGATESEDALVFSQVFKSAGNPHASPREVTMDSRENLVMVGHGNYRPDDFPDAPVNVIGALDDSSIFIIKLAPEGKIQWVTLLGGSKGTGAGSGKDRGYGLVLDSSDNIYVAGGTASTDFPTTPGAFDRTHNGGKPNSVHGPQDAYVLKLSANGRKLLYSTYLGGSLNEAARGGLEVDAEGNAYVVGTTRSPDFLANSDNHINSYIGGISDGFVAKVSEDGSKIIFNRFFGTPSAESKEVIIGARLGASGNLYLSGAGGVQPTGEAVAEHSSSGGNGASDVYVACISGDGRQLLFSTYIGGSNFEGVGHRMSIDDEENIYIAGGTLSADLPMVNASQARPGGGNADGYIMKLDSHGKLLFSTYLGGSKEDSAYGPSVDQRGYIYVTGRTASTDFPLTPDAYDRDYNGGDYDAYLQVYNPAGRLVYSTFLGGDAEDYARNAVAVDGTSAVIIGHTLSTDFPTVENPARHDGQEGLFRWMSRLITGGVQQKLFVTRIKVSAEAR